jgi:undecaprenyl-diphosphatase
VSPPDHPSDLAPTAEPPTDEVPADGPADEPLPPSNLIDAALEAIEESHPGLPLPHHVVDPPSRLSPVHRFDDVVDRAFDRIRGTEPADRILYSLTELGDFGLIWMLIGFANGLRSDAEAEAAWRLAAALGVESVLLNGLIKSQFKRERPVAQEARPYHIRIPMTTSFPSGHASTAMVASLLLTQHARPGMKPLYFGLAGLIAASRVHVRIHHASDVVGGVVVGTVLGLVARRVWPLRRR